MQQNPTLSNRQPSLLPYLASPLTSGQPKLRGAVGRGTADVIKTYSATGHGKEYQRVWGREAGKTEGKSGLKIQSF